MASQVAAAPEVELSNDDKLYWGTYRPYPYVGLRARDPQSPLIGLMWYKPSLHNKGLTQIRHECSYYDNMDKFGWTKHDGMSYASQDIRDPENNIKLNVQWVKPEFETDPNHWILRVEGSTLNATNVQKSTNGDDTDDATLIWYVATPDEQTATFNKTHIWGDQPNKGRYHVAFQEHAGNKNPSYVNLRNQSVPYNVTYF